MNIENKKLVYVEHPFKPVFDENSLVLILGTFPSIKSREENFYYAHKRNRFWKIISYITNNQEIPLTIDKKKSMLINNKIAIWDVIYSCYINKSSDSSIKNVVPMNLSRLINKTKINKIFANGTIAYDLYMKYCFEDVNIEIDKLPSTSGANAAYDFDKLLLEWEKIKYYLSNK